MFFVFLLVPSCSCMILSCLYAVFVFIAELLCLSILMFSFALRFFTFCFFFFFKQKPAYDWRISDWGSDVCSSDLTVGIRRGGAYRGDRAVLGRRRRDRALVARWRARGDADRRAQRPVEPSLRRRVPQRTGPAKRTCQPDEAINGDRQRQDAAA